MATLVLVGSLVVVGAVVIAVAAKLDARDRKAGRYMPTGGSLKPQGGWWLLRS